MYVCICKGVKECQIRDELRHGATSYEALQESLGVGECCGQCKETTLEIMEESLHSHHHENVVDMWHPRTGKRHLHAVG
jgi:bacterioferritin-associated ferredoxin